MKIVILVLLLSSPLVAQEVIQPAEPSPVIETEPQQRSSVDQHPEQLTFDNPTPPDRIVLFIDTFRYQSNTLELAAKSEQSQKNLSSSHESSSFVSASTAIGLKSYHNGLILGFGLSSNIRDNSGSAEAGVLYIGYELDASWQFGSLLFVGNSYDKHEVKRRLQVDGQTDSVTAITEESISRYSLGLWGKYAFNNYWRGQLTTYYATSSKQNLADNGQQARKEIDIKRRYLALTVALGAYVQVSQRLTFTPQLDLTYVLPLSYVQIERDSTALNAPPVEKTLDFDEQHSISYSLTLAGFRYQL